MTITLKNGIYGFIPPIGWHCIHRSGSATLVAPSGNEYHVDKVGLSNFRWCVSVFEPDAATGNRLLVSDLAPSTPHSQLAPDYRGLGDFAVFVHAFQAADAVLAYEAWCERNVNTSEALGV